MGKITFLVLLVLVLTTYACKKSDTPNPEPEATGCELSSVTSISNGKTWGGFTYFYEKGNLYSLNSTDSSGNIDTDIYTKYKFSGGKLTELGVVWGQQYTKEKQFEYSNDGKIALIKWFLQANSNSYTAYRFYYDNAGNCNHILRGKVTVDSLKTTAIITDSVGFGSYTALGKPQYLMQYTYLPNGGLEYHGGYKYEYDALGNCTKVIEFSPTRETIRFEYKYDLTKPFNKEYNKLEEIQHLASYHPYSDKIPPVNNAISKYPPVKQFHYNFGQLSITVYRKYNFDAEDRLERVSEIYSNNPTDTNYKVYTYTCK